MKPSGGNDKKGFLFLVLSMLPVGALAGLLPEAPQADLEARVADEIRLEGNGLDVVAVEAKNGVVVLKGQVTTLAAKHAAEGAALAVPGVSAVVNRVVVEPPRREDRQIHEDVREALRADPATESYEVTAVVNHGVVTLRGEVDSAQEKGLVERVVAGVEGVRSVDNQILVRPPAAPRADLEIEKEIESLLRFDAGVDDALVAVSVEDRVVALAGIVRSAREKARTILLSHVDGVKHVDASDLGVEIDVDPARVRKGKYEPKSDGEIERAVKKAFRYDARIRPFPIEVRVADGVVTLEGEVNHLQAKRAAENDAANVVGVVEVDNRIEVSSAEPIADEQIMKNVERALTLDPLVDQSQITVSVEGGKATLTGSVSSPREEERAIEAAARARGVLEVENELAGDWQSSSGGH